MSFYKNWICIKAYTIPKYKCSAHRYMRFLIGQSRKVQCQVLGNIEKYRYVLNKLLMLFFVLVDPKHFGKRPLVKLSALTAGFKTGFWSSLHFLPVFAPSGQDSNRNPDLLQVGRSLWLGRRLLQALQQVRVRRRVYVAWVRVSLHQRVNLLLSLLKCVRGRLQHVAVDHVPNVGVQTDLRSDVRMKHTMLTSNNDFFYCNKVLWSQGSLTCSG